MNGRFLEQALTPAVRSAQAHYYGVEGCELPSALGSKVAPLVLGPEEQEFITMRDSFYLATVSEVGWPYIQHRGGSRGFLKVTGPATLGFADYGGNRQLLSTGNLAANDRVALFLMDYPQRTRLKMIGHARVVDAREQPALAAQFAADGRRAERVFLIEITGFDWNCPKFITPRYTAAEVQELIAPLKARITELEAILKHQT